MFMERDITKIKDSRPHGSEGCTRKVTNVMKRNRYNRDLGKIKGNRGDLKKDG